MINCPTCRTKLKVISTRHTPGVVRRRRACQTCDFRQTTWESTLKPCDPKEYFRRQAEMVRKAEAKKQRMLERRRLKRAAMTPEQQAEEWYKEKLRRARTPDWDKKTNERARQRRAQRTPEQIQEDNLKRKLRQFALEEAREAEKKAKGKAT